MDKNVQLFDTGTNENLFPASKADVIAYSSDLMLKDKVGDDFLLLKDSGNNSYVKLRVNNGNIEIEQVINPNYNVLAIGNSITLIIPDDPNWWGSWGVAASEKSKDWCGQLQTMIAETGRINCKVDRLNAATWERNFLTSLDYILTNYTEDAARTSHIENYDLIIIRLGENVSDTASFQSAIETLIDNIRLRNDHAEIMVTGMVFASEVKNASLSAAATSKGATFVNLPSIAKSYIGAQVYGDDGQLHTIQNGGVANHPSDEGMMTIATSIYNVLSL